MRSSLFHRLVDISCHPNNDGGRSRLAQDKHLAAVIGAIGAVGLVTVTQAQSIPGTFCPVAELRINGVPGSVVREKLWEYKQDKPPAHPVFGYVDMACWFVADAVPIDIAKRGWFAVGSRGFPTLATQAVLEFADPQTVSATSGVGVTHDGLAIFGNVAPNRDCVFSVQVWSETCPRH